MEAEYESTLELAVMRKAREDNFNDIVNTTVRTNNFAGFLIKHT